ncbi:hypothetical protein Taro_034755 [Colocasia esculenta]|uniref:Uncharacterized protein n=1 Tax=Colocasia esculenta TaxID=4460 RepID=A0A843W3U0_COLES|nr:hypothetical protein [Colocasia esculenta]
MALEVAVLLPLLSGDVCMRAKCRELGGLLTSALGRQRSPRSRSGRDGGARRDTNHCAFLRNPSRTEQGKLCSARGSCCGVFPDGSRFWRCVGRVLAARLSRGAGERSPVFAFFAKSRFDPFEVCPGVGTVVTAVVARGVPEWWHSFGYGWYLYPVWVMVCGGTSKTGIDVELSFVEVMWCDLPLNVLYPSSSDNNVTSRIFRIPVDPGLTGWAQSAHRFSACKRDRGVRRVLNATALEVAFLLPLLSGDVGMRAKCRELGGLLTSALGRRRSPRSRSGRDGGARRDTNRCAFLRNPSRTEQGKLCSARGSYYGVFPDGSGFWRCVGRVLAARLSRGAGEMPRDLWSSHSSRRKGDPWSPFRIRVFACEGDGPRVLRPETLEVPDMDLQLCSRFDPFEVCPGVGTVVTAVVARGVPEWWHSFGYGWYLYPVWVMVYGGTSKTGIDVELSFVEVVCTWLAVLLPMRLRFVWEACSLGSDLPVWLKAWVTSSYYGLHVRLKA